MLFNECQRFLKCIAMLKTVQSKKDVARVIYEFEKRWLTNLKKKVTYEFKEKSDLMFWKTWNKWLKTLQSEEDIHEFEEIFKAKKWHLSSRSCKWMLNEC